MRSVFFDGRDVSLKEIDCPVRQSGESLIKIIYAGICNTDLEIIKGYMGFTGVLGHEFIGRVIDSDNKGIIGKRVAGEINIPCRACEACKRGESNHCPERSVLGILKKNGCFAEYITLPDRNLKVIPDNISDFDAVMIEPLAAAIRPLHQVHLNKNSSILVMGDGKMGLLSAIVFSFYFKDIVLMGKHEEKINIAKEYGIKSMFFDKDHSKFDIVIECTGRSDSFAHALNLLRPCGKLILKTTAADSSNVNPAVAVINELSIFGSRCGNFDHAIEFLSKGIDLSKLITKAFTLDNALKAISYSKLKSSFKILLEM